MSTNTTDVQPKQAKKDLRRSVKTQLAELSEDEVAKQSRIAQDSVLSLPQYRNARRISVYLSMPSGEARTDMVFRNALSSGKQVFVPYLQSVPKPETKSGKGKVMQMLRLSSIREYEGLERDAWGIPSLSPDTVEERENALGGYGVSGNVANCADGGLDLVVVPGVAFDEDMSRLGHGAGFYDGFLSRLCGNGRRSKPFLVGLCLAEQIQPNGRIVMEEWDWSVDAVAVGDGRLLTSKGV
ncbi:hypothetical protein BAUCODRAFT_26586 [Baudoinia panamericana UAMH 10762]|uniref:5-formyltetrahydrofolate cyclo-ligase n=1 Tax=Baudoinia panamericana (strain UAMH 10762) TaxID=717646 RepID=M2N2R5_BAUPA|nr:uncharacterized protein BAUCODRAFT_26586 [Baudoinia panamericana UAMH 10762]EMC93269.1 hypothetical protein BAUCODRAFT_26586 [Baudoinia panamericana UAMH 10762]